MALARAFEVSLRADPKVTGVAVGDTFLADDKGETIQCLMVCFDDPNSQIGGPIKSIPIEALICTDEFKEFDEEEEDASADEELLSALRASADLLRNAGHATEADDILALVAEHEGDEAQDPEEPAQQPA